MEQRNNEARGPLATVRDEHVGENRTPFIVLFAAGNCHSIQPTQTPLGIENTVKVTLFNEIIKK